ncbi:hypothetical protein Glove_95g46 [Diversispora epigaea]|uniref:Uncharacterized protein n=1 Tax=Diversispora epigaea TaxID=1348612 RepID=A0A397J9C3_9GLOM|nr:hypothetical protein Glove_95g46 [Diversispora epigaea]
MTLVTNYNLSNKATNTVICFFNEHSNLPLFSLPKNAKKGRELMEKMKILTLIFKKYKILTHNNINYYLFYHLVLNCIKNILSIFDISQNFTLRFENFKYKGEKAYTSLPDGSKLLSIILYSDVTTTDTLGKSSLYPIYISIGNISTKRRNKSDAKQLLGYLPILKAKDKFEKKSKDFKKLNTKASLPDGSKLLSIILYSDVTTTDTLGKSSLYPIYISIGNISTKRRNKSDAKQLLGYLPILKAKDKFEKKSKDFKKLVRLTLHNSMKFLLDLLFAKKGINLEVDNETYWFFPRISTIICDWLEATTFSLVYKSTNLNFPCHFYLISKTLLSNTDLSNITFRNNENMQEYFYNDAGQDVSLENIPNYFWSLPNINIYTATVPDRISLVGKIDDRLLKIPRFQKFQIFTNGLQSISRMIAKEYRILMKVMVFVVDNLYEENKNNVEDFVENRKLSEVYAKWNKMYMMSRSEIFTESDLKNFQFSAINGYTTETYESLYKDFVKIPYRMSNKKNTEDQIIKTLKRQDIINVINKKQKKKKPTKLLNFSSKLFETKLTEAYIYFCEKINDLNINDNMIKGFDQFLECFNDFLENILEIKDIKECDIIIYGMATLENGSIIEAKNKFHDKPWFSNVAISMDSNKSSDYQSDEGLCYGKILLMTKIEIKEKSLLNLALVQWYDFKFQKNSYLYNCPFLKLMELYNLIPIETILARKIILGSRNWYFGKKSRNSFS